MYFSGELELWHLYIAATVAGAVEALQYPAFSVDGPGTHPDEKGDGRADQDGRDRLGVWISTVTGREEPLGIIHDPNYWVRQVREPVRFSAAVDSLAKQADGPLLEAGAGGDLTYLAGFTSSVGKRAVAVQGRTADDEVRAYLGAVGFSWSMGVPVTWTKLEPRRRTPLPPHPMEGRDHGALLLGSEVSTAVDRSKEPEPRAVAEDSGDEATSEAVRTGAILRIFQDALGLSAEKLDGTFLTLGGDSLAAVQVVGRLRDEQGVTMEMAELMSSPSVSRLAAEIADRQDGEEDLTDALTSVLAEMDAEGEDLKKLGGERFRTGEDVR